MFGCHLVLCKVSDSGVVDLGAGKASAWPVVSSVPQSGPRPQAGNHLISHAKRYPFVRFADINHDDGINPSVSSAGLGHVRFPIYTISTQDTDYYDFFFFSLFHEQNSVFKKYIIFPRKPHLLFQLDLPSLPEGGNKTKQKTKSCRCLRSPTIASADEWDGFLIVCVCVCVCAWSLVNLYRFGFCRGVRR